MKREKRHVIKATVPRLLAVIALALSCAADVGAQVEFAQIPNGNKRERAAAAARQLFESALASDVGNQRFPALRAARVMNEPWIAQIVLPLCDSPDNVERVLALEVVANTDPRLGKAAFLNALTSNVRALRLRGLLGLVALGDPDTVPSLVKILREDPDPDLQTAAAQALGKLGDYSASIPLYEAIESKYPPVREQAVLALLAIGGDEIGGYLIDRLENDRHPGRVEVLRLLALVPDRSLATAIEPFLTHEDEVTRVLAAAAILSILKSSGHTRP